MLEADFRARDGPLEPLVSTDQRISTDYDPTSTVQRIPSHERGRDLSTPLYAPEDHLSYVVVLWFCRSDNHTGPIRQGRNAPISTESPKVWHGNTCPSCFSAKAAGVSPDRLSHYIVLPGQREERGGGGKSCLTYLPHPNAGSWLVCKLRHALAVRHIVLRWHFLGLWHCLGVILERDSRHLFWSASHKPWLTVVTLPSCPFGSSFLSEYKKSCCLEAATLLGS